MKSIYYKTGNHRSDYGATHECEILEQTSHRKATAGKDLIQGMNEALCLKEQWNEPSLLSLFFLQNERLCLKTKKNFQSDGPESMMILWLSNDSKGLMLIGITNVCLRSNYGTKFIKQ